MKHILTFCILYILSTNSGYGQFYNWNSSIDSVNFVAGANFGWEYSVIAGLNYGYKLPCQRNIILQTGFTYPFGKNILDDFKANVGLSGLLVNKNNFNSILSINAIHKRYASELVQLNSVCIDVRTINGFYKSDWFFSTEIGLELGLSTHFKHTETYKQIIYDKVEDGWYKPISAGIIYFGMQTGYSIKQNDLIFRIGFIKSITSPVNVLIPYYTTLGYNFKINK